MNRIKNFPSFAQNACAIQVLSAYSSEKDLSKLLQDIEGKLLQDLGSEWRDGVKDPKFQSITKIHSFLNGTNTIKLSEIETAALLDHIKIMSSDGFLLNAICQSFISNQQLFSGLHVDSYKTIKGRTRVILNLLENRYLGINWFNDDVFTRELEYYSRNSMANELALNGDIVGFLHSMEPNEMKNLLQKSYFAVKIDDTSAIVESFLTSSSNAIYEQAEAIRRSILAPLSPCMYVISGRRDYFGIS